MNLNHAARIAVALSLFSCEPSAHGADAGGARKAPARASSSILARITKLRSDSGTVYCALFAPPGEGFPGNIDKAVGFAMSPIAEKAASCAFSPSSLGKYAVSFYHDANNNRHFDTTTEGIPLEGYGASRDARGSYGPPLFRDAVFEYAGGALALELHTNY